MLVLTSAIHVTILINMLSGHGTRLIFMVLQAAHWLIKPFLTTDSDLETASGKVSCSVSEGVGDDGGLPGDEGISGSGSLVDVEDGTGVIYSSRLSPGEGHIVEAGRNRQVDVSGTVGDDWIGVVYDCD